MTVVRRFVVGVSKGINPMLSAQAGFGFEMIHRRAEILGKRSRFAAWLEGLMD